MNKDCYSCRNMRTLTGDGMALCGPHEIQSLRKELDSLRRTLDEERREEFRQRLRAETAEHIAGTSIGARMECPHCGEDINPAAMLRAIKSEKRAEASRENGKKGGRPPKHILGPATWTYEPTTNTVTRAKDRPSPKPSTPQKTGRSVRLQKEKP